MPVTVSSTAGNVIQTSKCLLPNVLVGQIIHFGHLGLDAEVEPNQLDLSIPKGSCQLNPTKLVAVEDAVEESLKLKR